jgi:hypothetical protein
MADLRLAAGSTNSYGVTWINNCDQGSAGGTYYYTTIYGAYSRTADQEENNKSTIIITLAITASSTYVCRGNWVGTFWVDGYDPSVGGQKALYSSAYNVTPPNGVSSNNHPVIMRQFVQEVTHADDGTWAGATGAYGCDGPPQNSRPSTVGTKTFDVPPIDRTVTLSTVTASNPGETTAKVSWTANKTCNKVEYQVNGGSWVTASTAEGSSGTFTASGLKEGSSNTINVRVTRKASGRTATKSTTVTTLEGNNMRMKINGSWKKGKAYVKVNGAWKKATPYVKVNGSWKKSTS